MSVRGSNRDYKEARVCEREGRNVRMADDPVWPDPFRSRIVVPDEGKKKRARGEEPLDAHRRRTSHGIAPII